MVPPEHAGTTRRRERDIAAACRVAIRIWKSGRGSSEALQFLANSSSHYLERAILIVTVPTAAGQPRLVASAGLPSEFVAGFGALDFGLQADRSTPAEGTEAEQLPPLLAKHGISASWSTPIHSTHGQVLGWLKLYGTSLREANAMEIAAQATVVQTIARILEGSAA